MKVSASIDSPLGFFVEWNGSEKGRKGVKWRLANQDNVKQAHTILFRKTVKEKFSH